jgi:hypothetical protein
LELLQYRQSHIDHQQAGTVLGTAAAPFPAQFIEQASVEIDCLLVVAVSIAIITGSSSHHITSDHISFRIGDNPASDGDHVTGRVTNRAFAVSGKLA